VRCVGFCSSCVAVAATSTKPSFEGKEKFSTDGGVEDGF